MGRTGASLSNRLADIGAGWPPGTAWQRK